MQVAFSRNKDLRSVTQMIFATNFAAIHTSSNVSLLSHGPSCLELSLTHLFLKKSMTHFLYDIAAHPECVPILRQEIEEVVREQGWTKDAMGKLWKLDSFMRESQRCNGMSEGKGIVTISTTLASTDYDIDLVSVMRKTVKGVTFSNGQYVPPGVVMVVPARDIHLDGAFYENPDTFDPFRFSRVRDLDGKGSNEQFASTSTNYVPFGLGKHAWYV